MRRILHTMLRVGDLDRSIEFYTKVLGMKLLRRADYPGGRFTNAFVGYDDESRAAVLELTYNWDTHSYDLRKGAAAGRQGHPRSRSDEAWHDGHRFC